jgi:hypothetical protein
MSPSSDHVDLMVLVADRDMRAAVEGLLGRTEALGIRRLRHRVESHPRHDAGTRLDAVAYLSPFRAIAGHALVLFDREGSGWEDRAASEIESETETRLAEAGWAGRSAVIVLDPELEAWVWSDSPHVDDALGWKGRRPALREWLLQQVWLHPGASKPTRPKEAMDAALRRAGKVRSSSLFHAMASKVTVTRCTDRSFEKLRVTLRKWFGTA